MTKEQKKGHHYFSAKKINLLIIGFQDFLEHLSKLGQYGRISAVIDETTVSFFTYYKDVKLCPYKYRPLHLKTKRSLFVSKYSIEMQFHILFTSEGTETYLECLLIRRRSWRVKEIT